MDPDGNMYVAGYTGGALHGNVNAGLDDIIVMKFDASGTHQWTLQHGGDADEKARGVQAGPASPRAQDSSHGTVRINVEAP